MPTRDPHTPGYVTATELPDGAVPDPSQNGNFILGPTTIPRRSLADPNRALDGTVVEFTMSSADSKYYPGIARTSDSLGTPDPAESRQAHSDYEPSGALHAQSGGLCAEALRSRHRSTVHRGCGRAGPPAVHCAGSLIAEQKLPAMIAISIGNGGGDAQGSERGLEYDTMSGKYAEFVEHEVLPRVETEAHVRADAKIPTGARRWAAVPADPARSSWRGIIRKWYHRVLAYSGTFVNQQWPWNPETPARRMGISRTAHPGQPGASRCASGWKWATATSSTPTSCATTCTTGYVANERMAEVLAAKGYHYQFVFARNAGHVDRGVRNKRCPKRWSMCGRVTNLDDERTSRNGSQTAWTACDHQKPSNCSVSSSHSAVSAASCPRSSCGEQVRRSVSAADT